MPTKQQVIDLINAQIVANGNNEITAGVLNPILLDMVNQINNLTGALEDLNTFDTTELVAAINEVFAGLGGGINIHSGTDDPNVIPPPSFSLGDFYQQTSLAITVAFYQYNGNDWARIITVKQGYERAIRIISSSYIVVEKDYTIIYNGANALDEIELPLAANSVNRVIKIVNRSIAEINFTFNYINLQGLSVSLIKIGEATEVHSDGTDWNKTN